MPSPPGPLPFAVVEAGLRAVGRPCAVCAKHIDKPTDGSLCGVCRKNFHHTCAGSQRFCPTCGNAFGTAADAHKPISFRRRSAGRRLFDWFIGRNRT